MTIHIYFRHTAISRLTPQARPSWFSYTAAFANLLSTIEGALTRGEVTLNIVYDGQASVFEADELCQMLAQFAGKNPAAGAQVATYFVMGGDQRRAWRACLSVVDSHAHGAPNDLIYFLENDYVHVPGWIDKVQELQSSGIEWHYLTLYDHPDKYPTFSSSTDALRYKRLKSKILATASHHWRTTPSTCATYLTRVRTYHEDRKILGLGLYDFKLFKMLGLFHRRVLLSPMPALATHGMSEFMAPARDWMEIVKAGDQ